MANGEMVTEALPCVTILSTADFDDPVWTNKQHLAVGLARSMDVVYIDSIGLRRPRFTVADISRVAGRLRKRATTAKGSRAGVAADSLPRLIIHPRVLPFHGSRIVRTINGYLLRRQILSAVPESRRDVLWAFTPLTYGLESSFGHTVYHSVDLLHTFNGVPSISILEAEAAILVQADSVIASSLGVADHLRRSGATKVILWENVADTKLYAGGHCGLPQNRAIFSGNLTATKIDFDLLFQLVSNGIALAIAGPVARDGTVEGLAKLAQLTGHPNVTYLGLLEPAQLALEVGDSRVGLIPYLLNDHTEGIFPMKVFEYLAGGLAVVSTPLSSLVHRDPILGLSFASGEQFVEATARALDGYLPEQAFQRMEAARPYSWANRLAEAEELILMLTNDDDATSAEASI